MLSTPSITAISSCQASLLSPKFLYFPQLRSLSSPRNLFLGGSSFYGSKMASLSGFGFGSPAKCSASTSGSDDGFSTLIDYVGKGGIDAGDDLVVLLSHIQFACKRIAALVASPFNSSLGKQTGGVDGSSVSGGSERDAPKPLDIVSVS